jgi:hypothetical protein
MNAIGIGVWATRSFITLIFGSVEARHVISSRCRLLQRNRCPRNQAG